MSLRSTAWVRSPRLGARVCSSVPRPRGGANEYTRLIFPVAFLGSSWSNSVVEPLPSKQVIRVRFPSPAPAPTRCNNACNEPPVGETLLFRQVVGTRLVYCLTILP